MARIIQDIKPMRPNDWQQLQKSVESRVRTVHQATNLPRLVQSAKSFDIIAPGKMRGAHFQRNLRHQLTAKPIKPVSHQAQTLPVASTEPPKKPAATIKQAHLGWQRRLLDFAQYPLIGTLAIAAAYSAAIGQYAIGLYALVALGFRVSSQYTFGAALVLLVSIPLFQVLHQSGVSQNAAIYAYELLVVGTIQAMVEVWFSNRPKRRLSSTSE